MTRAEARDCVQKIKDHVEDLDGLLLELHDRAGWKALGYSSWRECCLVEFGKSKSQAYRLKFAAKLRKQISPIGDNVPESHLRAVSNLPPDIARAVLDAAKATGKPTAALIEELAGKAEEMGAEAEEEDLAKTYTSGIKALERARDCFGKFRQLRPVVAQITEALAQARLRIDKAA